MLDQTSEITKEFEKIIKTATQNWPLKEYLQDVDNYGQSELVYYSETTSLYNQYKSDCDDWLCEQVEETGLKPWELFKGWDYAPNSEENAWIVVVAMFEDYCRHLLEDLDQ